MRKPTKRVLAAPDWRAALKGAGQVEAINRFVDIKREGGVSFVASTDTPDRYGDTIDQSGWKLDGFLKNPVLLWAHSHATPPVGRVGSLDTTGNLTAKDITFTPPEVHKFGAEIGEMVKAGFLNTVSVGFLPLAWEERFDQGGTFKGFHFTSMELLEISVVPVPANAEALVQDGFAKSLGEWTKRKSLAEWADDAPIAKSVAADVADWLAANEERAEREMAQADGDVLLELLAKVRAIEARQEAFFKAVEAALSKGAPAVVPEAPVTDDASGDEATPSWWPISF